MDIAPDIGRFVELRFSVEDRVAVVACIDCDALRTPRVARCVLFLANGSLSMLRHCAEQAKHDVRDILVEAEYVTEISDELMLVRDMSLPFDHERNLGMQYFADLRISGCLPKRAAAVPIEVESHQASRFVTRTFILGEATYTVLPRQTHVDFVLCRRVTERLTTIVQLPWPFVADQFAEHIEAIPA